ncbi:MAG: M14 family zinc carboxypeptidase, partial [Thermoleophilaceae bacterium]
MKCTEDASTPDGRVFPEADASTNFLRIDEFECGVALLQSRYPELIEIRTIGKSKGERPVYDIVLTDEGAVEDKQKLLVVSSIHGDEVGGREGGARVIEDMLDPQLLRNAGNPWVQQVLEQYELHFLFPNPDGWAKGDVIGSYEPGVLATRGNDNGRDLNRQFPVKGWIDFDNEPLAEPEGNAVMEALFSQDDWYLGTDNHGQGPDSYAAAGLQIVGQFDYQKSETLARFADGITESMKSYGVLGDLEDLRESTGQDLGSYHWGTLYDMLGYSASGSMIDYYNT